MTESMKFGPEWLRNLSQDGCTQPSVISAPRCQLAEHRYGREEMLALFDQTVKAPDLLSSIQSLYVEKTQEPLALQQMTEDETRMWNRGINSDAVLRLSGKTTAGISGILRGGRGGSIDRGRGRGRGSYHYSRGLSYEEPGDGSLRDRGEGPISSSNFQRNIRTFDRSQNSLPDRGWNERNGTDVGDWNGSSSPRKEVGGGRGFVNDNWRRHRGGGEDEDGWRTATSNRTDKWGRSNSWREGDKDGGEVERSGPGRGQSWERGRGWDEHNTTAHPHNPHRRPWDEDIPEWANENPSESGGSFDASGAFHGGEGYSDEDDHDQGVCGNGIREPQSKLLNENSEPSRQVPVGNENSVVEREHKASVEVDKSTDNVVRDAKCDPTSVSENTNSVTVNGVHDSASDSVRRQKSEDDMERMQEVADDLVAKLMDDEEGQDKPTSSATEKWFYRDPQGEVQGPFLSGEMAEWFRAGYFTLNLLVRRSCDERYAQLGDLINVWGKIPFMDGGTTFPPLKATDDISTSVTTSTQPTLTQGMSAQTGLDQENFLMQHYRYQLLQHQYLLRQQAVAGKLTQNENWSTLSPEQQQLIMQHLQPPVDSFVPPAAAAHTQKNPVMNVLSHLHQPKVPTTSVPDSPLSPSHSHPPALDPLQQLIQQMGGLQPSHHNLHTATTKPDTDSSAIHLLMRQLSSKSVKPQMESVWGGNVAPAAAMFAAQNWLGHMPAAPPGQFPLSSLWDLQGKDIKTEQQILEEQMQAEEERRREELRKQEETQRRTEEEEKRKQLEEELRKKEEEQQRMKEKLQKMEEERKRLEEQQKQKLAEEAAERKRQQEEAKRLEEEAAARKREEAARKKEEERKRKEEEKERKRKLEEERRREEEERQRQEEEQARKKQQQEEEERRLEQQRRQTEALRRLQEQQQQRTKAAPWSQQTPGTGSSLADIQRQEKEKKERELREQQQQQQQQQLLQQELQAQAMAAEATANASRTSNSLQLKWAERKPVQLNTVKSLAEIQAEEQEQLVKQQERERQERAQQQKEVVLPPSSGIWGTASQSLNWTSSSSTVWGSSTPATAGVAGFWDEVAPAVTKPASKAVGGKTKSSSALPSASNNSTVKASGGKTRSKKEEALVMKLFEQNVSRGDEFTQWCSKALSGLQSSVDIPTFVGFLRDIESPYEVKDYVRLYLGEGKEVQEFAKQFLERRSKWRSAQKAAPLEDDMCVPAPAVNPLNADFQEVKGKGKKAKKSKMFRVDNRILGFNVTAAQDRINVGDRDYGEI